MILGDCVGDFIAKMMEQQVYISCQTIYIKNFSLWDKKEGETVKNKKIPPWCSNTRAGLGQKNFDRFILPLYYTTK